MVELRRLMFSTLRKSASFVKEKELGKLGKIPFVASIYCFLYRHFKPSGIVLIDVQGSKMYVDPRDTGVATSLLTYGFHEKYEQSCSKSQLKREWLL